MKLQIKKRADTLEDALRLSEDEVAMVEELMEYAFRKYRKPASILAYLYEKLGSNDKLMAYALIMFSYTICMMNR